MWLTAPNQIGIAAWQSGDSIWRIESRCPGDGIQLWVGDECLALVSSDDRPLPPLDEQFVRGDELHLSFPQSGDSGDFGFRLVIRLIDSSSSTASPDRAVFELLVSIETTRLDAHPTLDLLLPARDGVTSHTVAETKNAVHLASNAQMHAAVLLGPQDAPFTSSIAQPGKLRLRLFGEFLEKGVIRRARPRIIVDRAASQIESPDFEAAWDALAQSPIPLS